MKHIMLSIAMMLTSAMLFPVALHAENFSVADYGAIGDGKTDDGPAIREAVAAAIAAGPGSRVVFEKKQYRMARYKGSHVQIELKDLSGVTLEGNGAEIINNPYNVLLIVNNCTDVTMRGFVFDCDPLSFTQGDITEVEPGKGEFLLKIHDGYVNPIKHSRETGRKAWGRVGFTIEADRRELKRGPIDSVESLIEVGAGEGLLRVKLKAKTFSHINKGDRFVISLLHGGTGANIHVTNSKDVRLEDYTVYGAKFGMVHAFTRNRGRVHVKGAKITFRPGSDRLVSSIRDGFHCKHNAVGPIIEDCLLEGMMDDSINISVCPYWVTRDLGQNRYLITSTPHKGDTLMAFTPNPGTVTHDLKVLAVQPQETPPGYRRGIKFSIVTLDRSIPDLGLLKGKNTFPGGAEKMTATGLYNMNGSGKDYIVRNNVFGRQRRYSVLARTTGGVIEGNTITGGAGIRLSNEIYHFYEGPFPGNTVIRNNKLHDTGSIVVSVSGNNAWAREITIENNSISGWRRAAISLSAVDGGIVRGNAIETGNGKARASIPIVIKNSRNLRIENNSITDNRPDLAAVYNLASGVDSDTLVMAGNGETLHKDFPAGKTYVRPWLIQLRGQAPRLPKRGENTGASCGRQTFVIDSRAASGWFLHPPWRNGARGAVLFDLPMDVSNSRGIRFVTKGTGKGDGVVLTIAWRPAGAADEEYKTCYTGRIDSQQWTPGRADIRTEELSAVLRFSFDCGPANSTAHDSVQIANLELVGK